jgi:uncharacterized protein YacL
MSKRIRSNVASVLFLYSAWIVILMGIFMLCLLSPWLKHVQAGTSTNLMLEVLGGILGVVGALAALVIWFGMLTFCLSADSSPLGTRILWLLLFLVMAWFGSTVYFFRVYKRQVQFASK